MEVNKLIDAGFIREVKYSTWITNIVPVRKKNSQLRICVDFWDANDACPKDDCSFLATKLMIDATTDHEALSFMDCTAGYNQIQMTLADQEAHHFVHQRVSFATRWCLLAWKMWEWPIKGWCKPFLTTCCTKLSSAIWMIWWSSLKRRQIICKIFGKSSKIKKMPTKDESTEMRIWCHILQIPKLCCLT